MMLYVLPVVAQAASDVYAPVSGVVTEVNSALVEDPAKVQIVLPPL